MQAERCPRQENTAQGRAMARSMCRARRATHTMRVASRIMRLDALQYPFRTPVSPHTCNKFWVAVRLRDARRPGRMRRRQEEQRRPLISEAEALAAYRLPSFINGTLGTSGLVCIWLLEALNFVVHVAWRPERWNVYSTVAGYSLWALQLACFARCQWSDPGTLPADWDGEDDTRHVTGPHVCRRTGLVLPARARYVRRAGCVVLGLDHYCGWMGTPIGYLNRKFFVLFVSYSAIFAVMGAAHSGYELLYLAPARLGRPPAALPSRALNELARWRLGGAAWELAAASHAALADFIFLCEAASAHGQLPYVLALTVSAVANPFAALILCAMAAHFLLLVGRNRTMLAPRDSRYDLGFASNMRLVFGDSAVLWGLPVGGSGGGADGLRWRLNPHYRVGGGAATAKSRR